MPTSRNLAALGVPQRRALPAPTAAVPQRRALPAPAPRRSNVAYVPLAVKAAAKAKADTHPRSMWEQVSDVASGIIPGVVHIAKEGFNSTPLSYGVRSAWRAAHGQEVLKDGALKNIEDYSPISASSGKSILETGKDIKSPERFAQAVREGRILDKVLEDAGNVALVAGPAAKALGAVGDAAATAGYARTGAALGGAADTAKFVASMGGKVGDLPVSGPRALLEKGTELGRRGLNALADSERFGSATAARIRDVAPLRIAPEGQIMREAAGKAEAGSRRGLARMTRDTVKEGGGFDGDLAPSLGEQGAAIALMNGVGNVDQVFRALNPLKTAEEVRQAHVLHDIPEQTYTADIQDIVKQYQDGSLDPEARARVERVMDAAGRQAGKVTDHALSGEGRLRGPIKQEWLGDDPIDESMYSHLSDEGMSRTDLQAIEQRRAAGETWEDIERSNPEVTGALDNLMNYPKAWRPAMRAAGLANENLSTPVSLVGTADPVAGTVRMWRGEHADPAAWTDDYADHQYGDVQRETHGRWFSPDQEYAQRYPVGSDLPKKLRYVDLPQDVFDRVKNLGDQPESVRGTVRPLAHEFEAVIPPEFADQVRDYEPPVRGLPSPRISVRPPDLMQMGVDRPTYFSGAPSELAQPRMARVRRERTNVGTSGARGLSSEHISVGNEFAPYSLRTLGESLGHEMGTMEYNRHLLEGIDKANLPTVEGVIGQSDFQQIVLDAEQEAQAQRLTRLQTSRLVGSRVNKVLEERGYSALQGDVNMPKAGDFDPSAPIRFEELDAHTPVLQSNIKNKLVQYWAPKGGGLTGRSVDWVNKKFKGNVLPFSLRWQAGDLVGGPFMAWLGGGVNPAELGGAMSQLKHLSPEAVEQLYNHPDFADASLSQGESQVINLSPDAPAPKTPIGKLKNASFRLNNSINKLNRHAYLLAKADKLLGEHGLSVDKLDRGNPADWQRPEVQEAIQSAVDDAMQVMGSFDELTPFEQRYMKRVFPFYTWNRHITGLAARTAIDNPLRMAWAARVGSIGSNPDEDVPQWLKGSIPVGGQLWPTNFVNPLNDVASGDPIYTPTGALKSMSPAIKLLAAGALGSDLNRGGLQITRPYGTGNTDEQGHDTITPLMLPGVSFKPLEFASQIAKTLPFTRVATDLLPTHTFAPAGGAFGRVSTGPHPRYGSGVAMVDKHGDPIDTSSRVVKALPLIGFPAPTSIEDAEAIQNSGRKRTALGTLKARKVKIAK